MTTQQRLVLWVSILASFVAFLDGSVVNVALPAIARELGGGLVLQQWVVDAYLITLGSLILVAGSFSDLFGRKRVMATGLIGFAAASVLCAVSPSGALLVVARALQGVAGALLVPSSLALIISSFSGRAQGKAVGSWTAWTGIAFIVGPLVGGALVDSSSWRLIFAINIIPIGVTLWLMRMLDREKREHTANRVDWWGALLCAVGLGAPVYALIEQSHYGFSSPAIYLPLIGGIASFTGFLLYERRAKAPMLPLELFRIRNFSAGNIATVSIYSGLSIATFLLALAVQQLGGYSAFHAGLALLPVTIIMFLLSPRFGALAGKFGPRLFMTCGPIIAALGFVLLAQLPAHMDYVPHLLPGIFLFGVGLSATVAPLTSAVLGSIDSRRAGIASAVNNAVARIAGLLAIAMLGLVTGPVLSLSGVHRGLWCIAGLLLAGGVLSWFGIRNSELKKD
ncbi:MAG TPA: MFS transporter [Candidatus Saccharimonadales bacterium]|nr:MFS transporter [Candidatus Saccharimonadales bacterium]